MHVKYSLYNTIFFSNCNKLFSNIFSHDLGIFSGINELPSLHGLNKVAFKNASLCCLLLRKLSSCSIYYGDLLSVSPWFLTVGLV